MQLIAFENWNTERAERTEERALHRELRSNLLVNIGELQADINLDSRTVAGFETILSHISQRRPRSEELSAAFANLENGESLYLPSSAYETLRSRGLDLISDLPLRQEIVQLFEGTYAALVGDQDRSEWINYEVSMLPLVLRHVYERPGHTAEPIDYQSLLDDVTFRVALSRSLALRAKGVIDKQRALDATRRVAELIGASLGD